MARELVRHPQLYFADGDIVLSAQLLPTGDATTRQYQLYRVHKAHLGFYSSVFANLFADGNAGLGPVYDGQPLVELLHPDAAEGVSRLLAYFYNPFQPLCERWDPCAPVMFTPVIRLADKYLVENLRAALIKQVVKDWPCTLATWDTNDAEAAALKEATGRDVEPSVPPVPPVGRFADCIPEPASAIMFAQEFGCTEILPAAFYQLCRLTVRNEFVPGTQDYWYPGPDGRLARWALLDRANLEKYLHGCEALDGYHSEVEIGFQYGSPLSPGCIPWWAVSFREAVPEDQRDRSEWPCYAFAERILKRTWEEEPREPLGNLLRMLNYETIPDVKQGLQKGFCQDCHWAFTRWILRERKEVWEQLPEFFHLSEGQ